jgi:hypothetical protein
VLKPQAYLGDLIRERVSLGRLTSTGYYEQKCAVCNDKKTRAGWKITEDEVFAHCYNCNFSASYTEGTGKFSRWMKEVCNANGITNQDLQNITATLFFSGEGKSEKEITLEELRKVNLNTPEVAFPDRTFQLGSDGHDDIQEPLITYLMGRRVDPLKFYFSLDKAHQGRVIIPFFRNNKLIFWQSRAIDNKVKPRYLNCVVSRDAVFYGYDKLFEYSDAPLFVTEGPFDAENIDGVCILGSKLNASKIDVLKKTKRRIIFVIDRDKNGEGLGTEVLKQGWELTFVDPRADDINDSVQKFGKLYTIYCLIKNATNKADKNLDARLMLDIGMLEAKLRKSSYA